MPSSSRQFNFTDHLIGGDLVAVVRNGTPTKFLACQLDCDAKFSRLRSKLALRNLVQPSTPGIARHACIAMFCTVTVFFNKRLRGTGHSLRRCSLRDCFLSALPFSQLRRHLLFLDYISTLTMLTAVLPDSRKLSEAEHC